MTPALVHILMHVPQLANYARDPSFSDHLGTAHPRFATEFAAACTRYWDDDDLDAARTVLLEGDLPCVLESFDAALAAVPVTDADRPFPFRGDAAAWGVAGGSLVSEIFRTQVRTETGYEHPMVFDVHGQSIARHFAGLDVTHFPPILVVRLQPDTFVSYDVVMAVGDRRYALFAVLLRHADLRHADREVDRETALCLRGGTWTHMTSTGAEPVHVNDVIQKDAVAVFYKALAPHA